MYNKTTPQFLDKNESINTFVHGLTYNSNPNKELICSIDSPYPHGKPKNEFPKKWRKDYKISIIMATRGRTDLLLKCIDSFIKTSHPSVSFEFVLVVDFDDKETICAINELVNERLYSNIICIITFRSYFMQRDYNNLGVDAASGDLIFVLNDDVEMVTNNWNLLIYNRYLEIKQEDDIHLIAVLDNGHPYSLKNGEYVGNGPCFPVVTKTFTNLFNGLFPPGIFMWSADIVLHNIFNGIGRRNILHEVSVFHNCSHGPAKNREPDEIHRHVVDTHKLNASVGITTYEADIIKILKKKLLKT